MCETHGPKVKEDLTFFFKAFPLHLPALQTLLSLFFLFSPPIALQYVQYLLTNSASGCIRNEPESLLNSS